MIFFNKEPVREFLLKNGLVYTLRKPRKRIGNDIAVYGSFYKNAKIADVTIELVMENLTSAKQLKPYVSESGLEDSQEWLKLAQKLSGQKLNLYKVVIRK